MLSREELDELCAIADRAGEAVMSVYATDFSVEIKSDDSPLTQADLRSDAIICEALRSRWPRWPIVSEESAPKAAPAGHAPTFFLVDPLDGTKEFLKRNGEFTVNIALIHAGEPVAGVVFAPALDAMYFGANGLGAWRRHAGELTRLYCQLPAINSRWRVTGSRSHGNNETEVWIARLDQPHTFVPAGSSLKFCRIAEGSADIYPRLGPTSQWDTAAGDAVLRAAGGIVLDARRQPMRYGTDLPVLNGNFVALADSSMRYPDIPEG
jgi:3'(2'),5'-bisphosphate nucleotidase